MRRWWNIKCVTLIIFTSLIFCNIGWPNTTQNQVDKHIDRILSLALLSMESHDNMIIRNEYEDVIDNIDKKGLKNEELIRIYVGLLDYYIGESTGAVLSEKITLLGDKISPFLVEKKNLPLECSKKYKNLCLYKSMDERNVKINRMISAIKQDRVLYAEFPENLRAEHEKDVNIIHIFIQDYRKKADKLPDTLDTLREYAWREYGYKLKIYSPWFGKPLKYFPQKNGKYILEPGDDKP